MNSNPVEHPENFTRRVSSRLRQLRGERGLTLQELAHRSGVSRAMISRIERNESRPSALVLDRLSTGLGVLLPALLGNASYRSSGGRERQPISTPMTQRVRQDSRGGTRRWLSPPHSATRMAETLLPDIDSALQLEEHVLPAGGSCELEAVTRILPDSRAQLQIWIMEGTLQIRQGCDTRSLKKGDCAAVSTSIPCTLHSSGSRRARYLLARASIFR